MAPSSPNPTSQLPPRAASVSSISNPPPMVAKSQEPHLPIPAPLPSQGALVYALPSNRVFPPPASRPLSSSDQLVTVANLGRNAPLLPFPPHPHPRHPYGFVPDHSMRPPSSQNLSRAPPQVATAASLVSAPGPRTLPALHHSKADQIPTITSITEYKSRDKNSDDPLVLVNGRKVRLNDGASTSLYALCRSWVRNGLPQENQLQSGENGRTLSRRPLPVRTEDTLASKKNDVHVHEDDLKLSGREECAGSVDNMSVGELLKDHIKRAKKVRARIRGERLQQIHPYRQRLYSIIERIQQAEADHPTVGNSDVLSVFGRPFKTPP